MNRTALLLAIATLSTAAFASTQPAEPEDCAQKRAGLHAEVEKAQTAGNTNRVRGLERALAEIEVSCTEPGMKAKRDRRISTQEKKVSQRQRELDAAERDGKASKIASRQAKLKEAQDELARLKAGGKN